MKHVKTSALTRPDMVDDDKDLMFCGPSAFQSLTGLPSSRIINEIKNLRRDKYGAHGVMRSSKIKGMTLTEFTELANRLGYKVKSKMYKTRPQLKRWIAKIDEGKYAVAVHSKRVGHIIAVEKEEDGEAHVADTMNPDPVRFGDRTDGFNPNTPVRGYINFLKWHKPGTGGQASRTLEVNVRFNRVGRSGVSEYPEKHELLVNGYVVGNFLANPYYGHAVLRPNGEYLPFMRRDPIMRKYARGNVTFGVEVTKDKLASSFTKAIKDWWHREMPDKMVEKRNAPAKSRDKKRKAIALSYGSRTISLADGWDESMDVMLDDVKVGKIIFRSEDDKKGFFVADGEHEESMEQSPLMMYMTNLFSAGEDDKKMIKQGDRDFEDMLKRWGEVQNQ